MHGSLICPKILNATSYDEEKTKWSEEGGEAGGTAMGRRYDYTFQLKRTKGGQGLHHGVSFRYMDLQLAVNRFNPSVLEEETTMNGDSVN